MTGAMDSMKTWKAGELREDMLVVPAHMLEGFALVPVEVKRDAERWQAFINCARIKLFVWAGYTNPDPNGNDPKNYRHFGGEFWTVHDAPTADKEKAREILNGFADAAIAAAPKGDSHE